MAHTPKQVTALSYYRALFRRITRLPLDRHSLDRLRCNARTQFLSAKDVPTYSVVDRNAYNKAIAVMDDVLSRKYKNFRQLLDLVYKPSGHWDTWVHDFHHTRYGAFKPVWPQVHLIEDFGDSASISLYRAQLKLSLPPKDFSLMAELNLEEPVSAPSPLFAPASPQTNIEALLEKYTAFHSFISQNASRLSELKIQPMEVYLAPNRYGLPESVTIRESKLKQKINMAKFNLATFKPLQENDLQHLIKVIESCDQINPRFYRSSVRQKTREDLQLSPLVKKYVQHKTLVPNERNIKFYYREYVHNQFFVDSEGKYQMTPRNNFYK